MRGPLYFLTHWYTYRTVVGVLMGVVLGVGMYFVYADPNLMPVHPEDRLFSTADQPDSNVVIVGIDDKSIQNLGHWPWSRDRFATILDNLHAANAGVVAFDVGFTEPTVGSGDALFAKAIAKDGPVVLAYGQTDLINGDGDYRMPEADADNRPLDTLVCADPAAKPGCRPVAQLGSTAVVLDGDGVVRRVPMFVDAPCATRDATGACQHGTLNPLGFVAYSQFLAGGDALTRTPGGAALGQAWPSGLWTDAYGSALVHYTGGPNNYKRFGQYLSAADVYSGNFDRGAVDNKIVLVGVDGATGIHDEQLVPTGYGTPMAGVEIHANLIQTLNSQGQKLFLAPEPSLWVLLSLLLIGVALGVALPRFSAIWGAAITAGVAVAYTLFWVPLFALLQTVPVFLEVWLAIGLTYAGLMAYRFLYEEREKRKVKGIFGKYLKPELVEVLASKRSLQDITLGGDRREVSLLFVDIRGFTHMSESMDAADVLKVLDIYLDELTAIVFKWDGTLDKYVGDEIMAIWNAPHEQAQHALLAVRCAWDMVDAMPRINARLAALGLPQIMYGVGVNTGPATVGFMGTGARNTYTAIGDTVNTAARFCGAAGPTQILIGQQTYEECRDYIAVDMVPGVQLKGKSAEKFTIYRITAIREQPGSPWVTVPGLETYSEVGVYHQQTMIGAGATVALDSNVATATGIQEATAPA